jgi:hypothetical protein
MMAEMEGLGGCFEGGAAVGDFEATDCGICLEPIGDRGEIACDHLFCFTCIERWAAQSRGRGGECPVCKVKFRSIVKRDQLQRELDALVGEEVGSSTSDSGSEQPARPRRARGARPSRRSQRREAPSRRSQRATAARPAAQRPPSDGPFIVSSDDDGGDDEEEEYVEPVGAGGRRPRRARRVPTRYGGGGDGHDDSFNLAQAIEASLAEAANATGVGGHMIGEEEQQAIAMAVAASLQDVPSQPRVMARERGASSTEPRHQAESGATTAAATTKRARASSRARRSKATVAATAAPRALGKRFIAVDPISGQRLRGRRFHEAPLEPLAAQPSDSDDYGSEHDTLPQEQELDGSETEGEESTQLAGSADAHRLTASEELHQRMEVQLTFTPIDSHSISHRVLPAATWAEAREPGYK